MAKFTDEDLTRLNEQYAHQDIPFHARPLRAAVDILGGNFSIELLGSPEARQVTSAYQRLFPEVDSTWPGMGVGLSASLDRVRKVKVGVGFGRVHMTAAQAMGFESQKAWWEWCGFNHNIAVRSEFAFTDMFDLVYGVDDQPDPFADGVVRWRLAAEQLELVADSLSQSGAPGSAVLQPICLTAELSVKGTLLQLGM